MHSRRFLSFFLANIIGAPQGEVLCLIKLLSNNSCIWTLSSCNSIVSILCGVIEMGDVPRCNSMIKSTSLYRGNPDSSSGKTSPNWKTTRGRLKLYLTLSSRVRLSSQPINCLCHLESYTVWGKALCLSP